MAISYVSQVVQANPYVLPVDLNLLARVNAYKQQQFYTNADKIGGMLSNIKNSDIANEAQRNKLLDKYNNLNSQLNNAGALDYSDRSLTNKIESYGSEILSDQDIYRGIVSTKKIRAFEANVQKMQTDPKLSKYYNVSNITRIMEQQIKPYVTGDISASYTGPTAPRPYEGNPFEKLLKNMKNLPPDITVRLGTSGTPSLYRISTNEELSPADISATFDGLIDANTKAQLMDDAWYNFDYATGYKFDETMGRNIYNDEHLNKSRSYQTSIDANIIRLKTETNPETRAAIQKQIADYQEAKTFSEGEIVKGTSEFNKMWAKDPEQAKYGLYVGKMRGDLIKAAGFSKEKVDFKVNQEWTANKGMELEAFKQGYQLNSDGTFSELPWASDGKGGKKGAKAGKVDDPDVSPVTFLSNSERNTAETKALAIDESKINSQINEHLNTNNQLMHNFLSNFAQDTNMEGSLGYKLNVNTTQPGVAQTFSSDFIANLAGADGLLDKGDIDRLSNATNALGNKGGNITYGGKKFGVTTEQVQVLHKLQGAWNAVATGQIDKLPSEFKGMAKEFIDFNEKYQTNQTIVENARQYKNKVLDMAVSKFSNLSAQDKQVLKEFELGTRRKEVGTTNINTPDSRGGTISTKSVVYDPEYSRIIKKIDKSKIKDYTKEAYKAAGQTYNYFESVLDLSDESFKSKVTNLVTRLGESGTITNVAPTSIRKTDDGKEWQLSYRYGKSGKEDVTSIRISNETAAQLGVPMLKRPEIQDVFRYGARETKPYSTYIKIKTAPTAENPQGGEQIQPLVYKIQKRSEGNYVPVVVYGGRNYPIKSSRTLKNTDEAYDLLQSIRGINYKDINHLLQIIETSNSAL